MNNQNIKQDYINTQNVVSGSEANFSSSNENQLDNTTSNIKAISEQAGSNLKAKQEQNLSNQDNLENLKTNSEKENEKDNILIAENPVKKIPIKFLDYRIICKSILKCNGNVAEIAKDLGYSYSATYQFFKKTKNNTIKRVLEQSKEIILDIAESKLIEHINSIDPRISLDAVKFTLSTLGKNRGFTNKQEIALNQDVLLSPDFDQLRQLKQDFSNILKIDIDQNFIDNQEIAEDTEPNTSNSEIIEVAGSGADLKPQSEKLA